MLADFPSDIETFKIPCVLFTRDGNTRPVTLKILPYRGNFTSFTYNVRLCLHLTKKGMSYTSVIRSLEKLRFPIFSVAYVHLCDE